MTHISASLRWGTGELKQGQCKEGSHEVGFSFCHEQKEEWVSQNCEEGGEVSLAVAEEGGRKEGTQ